MSGGETVGDLLALMDLEKLDEGMFRGQSPKDSWQRVFGGQVIGQALTAATRTVEGRGCHSLHAYFLRPGDPSIPIIYMVDRSRDGGSFSSRRVVALQRGKQIFHMSASFQGYEDGFEHQDEAPKVPRPDELEDDQERRLREEGDKYDDDTKKKLLSRRAMETRTTVWRPMIDPSPMEPSQEMWMRARGEVGDEVGLNQCLLAYASDLGFIDTGVRPHGVSWATEGFQTASLDHAMWFHRRFRMDEWLLFSQRSPTATGGRGLNVGYVYDEKGALVASAVQEGLMRQRNV